MRTFQIENPGNELPWRRFVHSLSAFVATCLFMSVKIVKKEKVKFCRKECSIK